MDSFSISNTLSRGSVYESDSMLRAYRDDAAGRLAGSRPEAISNERIGKGDLLRAPYPDGSFDGVLSQCAFFLSGDPPGAYREAWRLLKPGGVLMLSDVCFEAPEPLAEAAGFRVEHAEDLTAAWREYYLEALWRGTAECCGIRGKCDYRLLICRKE